MTYFFHIRIADVLAGGICGSCARELSAIGGAPVVTLDPSVSVAVISGGSPTPANNGVVSEWFVPFQTTDYGVVQGMVSSNATLTPYLLQSGLQDLHFVYRVSPFTYQDAQGATQNVLSDATLSSARTVTQSTPATTFQLQSVPFWSTSAAGVVNRLIRQPSTTSSSTMLSQFLYSENEWATSTVVTIPTSVTATLTNVCQTGAAVVARQMPPLKTTVLLNTDAGVLLGQVANRQVQYTNILPRCIANIQSPQQLGSGMSARSRAFFYGQSGSSDSGRIWTMRPQETTVTELLVSHPPIVLVQDSSGNSLAAALSLSSSNIAVLGVDASIVSYTVYNVLTHILSNGTYVLMSYDASAQTWNRTFAVPQTVSTVASDVSSPVFDAGDPASPPSTGSNPVAPVLNGMTYSRQLSNDLFLYGNVLLYSPTGGQSMSVIQVFTDGSTITSLVFPSSNADTSFLVQTSRQQLYYGELGLPSLTLVPVTLGTSPATANYLFYDQLGTLQQLSVLVDSSSVQVARAPLTIGTGLDLQLRQTLPPCPYSTFEIDASQDTGFTRSLVNSGSALPSAIYLDLGMNYTFTVTLTPSPTASLNDLVLSVRLANAHYVNITSVRTVYTYLQQVVYTITIADQGTLSYQMQPSDTPLATELYLYVRNGYRCKDPLKPGLSKNALARSATIFTGCPPYQAVVGNFSASDYTACETLDPAVPCYFFDLDYSPSYFIQDQLSGATSTYSGLYTLSLVGGGHSKTSIQMYTVNQSSQYNRITWGPVEELTSYTLGRYIYNVLNNTVNWICASGSPCAVVLPKFPQTAAYYFVIEMSTAGVTANTTYCSLSTQYLIRLNGLPVDFGTSLTATLATMGITLALVMLGAFAQWRYQRRELFSITPTPWFAGDPDMRPLQPKKAAYDTFTPSTVPLAGGGEDGGDRKVPVPIGQQGRRSSLKKSVVTLGGATTMPLTGGARPAQSKGILRTSEVFDDPEQEQM
ncbi:hypothetical protein RI367_007859 [Sorochytrium milnesiophthora]